jgi:alpha-L-rhamnosidase
VEVRGYPGTPTLAAMEGRVVHDDMKRVAKFESSNPLLNRIYRNIFWGVRGNYRSIPTDCPQRDERMGWLGDRSVVSRSESYLFDVAAFYTKWNLDIADAQRPTGSVPNVAPAYWVLYSDNITWPGTFLLVPEMLLDQYADRRVLERDYPAMKKWVDYMRGSLKDDLMPRDTYGDWCVPPESPELIHSKDPARKTDGTLIGSAYYYKMLLLIGRFAGILGKTQDEGAYSALAERVRTAFHNRFYKPDRQQYDNGTQTSSILPLAFGMTPPELKQRVFDGLVRKIETESRNHVGTGLVGAQWLMRTLSENGRADLAYTIATQKSYPGWGYMISKDATTIWELWNGDTADPAMNSGNHVMQIGDLNVWMYEFLAGIRPDPANPGFEHVIIKPHLVSGLSFARASHRSIYGEIECHWRRQGKSVLLDVTVPANTKATIHVPAASETAVMESGQPVAKARGVRFLRMEGDAAVFSVGSGRYAFRAGE